MSLLTIHYADGRTVPVPITKDAMVIGRDATCDIPLEDAITSRQHARFERDSAGNFWIQDLESKNGTTVNDRAVERSQLRAGDRIGIGGCFLTLANEALPSIPQLSDAPVNGEAPTTRAWDTSQRIVLPQQRLEKLYELNERLTGRFDRKDLLEEVLRISVELLRFERAGIAVWRGPPHAPDWVAWRNVSTDKFGEFQISRSLVDRALHNAERILVRDASMELADPTASIISNNIQSAMCVPMIVHDRVQGVMYGDRVTSTGGYTHEDTDFFAALGRLGAMGLANAQLAEEMKRRQEMELQIEWAREIQNGLSPSGPLIQPGLQIAALNDPGQHVSGDYYDYFVRPDGRIVIVMADVMGKGIPASLLMANLQAGVRVTLDTEDDLARGVGVLNQLICNNVREARFITALFGVLDPESGKLTLSNAGHWPPYRMGASGDVTALELESALPLGIELDCQYVAADFDLRERPTTLFLFTDGVPEAENDSDGQLGFDRLVEMLRNNAGREPVDLLRRVRTSVNQFTRNHPQSDDITMMAIRLE